MQEVLANAVTVIDGQPCTTSLKIAEIFGKEHKNVIQSIENLEIPADLSKLIFQPTSISVLQPKGGTREVKAYQITRDGFVLLAMGFTGKRAMKFKVAYIQAFNAMEAELKKKSDAITAPADVAAITKEIIRDTSSFCQNEFSQLMGEFREVVNDLKHTVFVSCKHLAYGVPSSWRQVAEYCDEEGFNNVNPLKFFNYYEARRWRIDGITIDNWHSVCASWELNERERIAAAAR